MAQKEESCGTRRLIKTRNEFLYAPFAAARWSLLALSGHRLVRCTCLLLGVKRTFAFALQMSAFDPKRTTFLDQLTLSPGNTRRLQIPFESASGSHPKLLISALGHLGQIDEARRVWSELKQLNPKYSFAGHLARLPYSSADADRIKEGIAKAGLWA